MASDLVLVVVAFRRYAPDKPSETDPQGVVNNVVEVTPPSDDQGAEEDVHVYGQVLPKDDDFVKGECC